VDYEDLNAYPLPSPQWTQLVQFDAGRFTCQSADG